MTMLSGLTNKWLSLTLVGQPNHPSERHDWVIISWMIISITDKYQAFSPLMIIRLMDPLSLNLMGGYDLVILITILFEGPNNLEDLINIF